MRGLAGVRRWSRSQRGVRLVVLVAPAVGLLASAVSGDAPPVWLVLVALLVGAVAATAPESAAVTVAMAVVVAWWGLGTDPVQPSVLVAAAMLTAVHVAALLAALGPPGTPLDAPLVRRWVARGAGVLVAAPVLWVVARALEGRDGPAALWPAALAVSIAAVVAVAASFPTSGEPV